MPNTSVTVEYSYWPGLRFWAFAAGATRHAARAADAQRALDMRFVDFIISGTGGLFEAADFAGIEGEVAAAAANFRKYIFTFS